MNLFRRYGPLAVLFLFVLPVNAHEFTVGEILIDHPWAQPLPPVSVNGAAYISIENRGESADILVGGESPVAEKVEIHEHVHENGTMKMQPVAGGLKIAGGEQVMFKPGGLHLMLIGLRQPLVEGETFPITLQFEQAGEIVIVVNIEKPQGGEMNTGDMDHSKGMNADDNKQGSHGTH